MTAEDIERKLLILIALAEQSGYVVTIETRPTQPLRMGGYEMVGEVRKVRDTA